MNEYWGIGMGWSIMLILAILVIIVGIYYKVRKKG
jgi:hypothetical protein